MKTIDDLLQEMLVYVEALREAAATFAALRARIEAALAAIPALRARIEAVLAAIPAPVPEVPVAEAPVASTPAKAPKKRTR